MTRTNLLVVLWMSLAVVLQAGAAELAARPSGKVLFDSEQGSMELVGRSRSDGRVEAIDPAGQPFTRGWRVETLKRPAEPHYLQLGHNLEAPLVQGHVMLLRLWARCPVASDETNEGKIGVLVEQTKEPWGKEVMAEDAVGAQWRELNHPFRVRHDHTASGSRLSLRLGYAPQTVEIGGVELIDLGPDARLEDLPRMVVSYVGREPEAAWRAAAEQRIEKHRKADLVVEVIDSTGRPVPGAQVEIAMQRHAFPFGCVYNPIRIAGRLADDPGSEKYREMFASLFNMAVDEWSMKWPGWEQPHARDWAVKSLEWMQGRGIPVRGHNLVWPSWRMTPRDLQQLANDPAAMRSRIAEHISAEATAFAGRVVDWDVVNEPYTHNDVLKVLGREVMVDWFRLARQADPNARLYLNEAGQPNSPPDHERYDILEADLKMLLKGGAPVDGIGMQGHFGETLNSPQRLLSIYDRFAALGLPIRITELDIATSDERLQADYLRDFMTVSFSHPAIDGIVMWGFWEGQHWRPAAALFRTDWSPKPAGQVWMKLVQETWWTRETKATSDHGIARVRGFLGEYEIKVSDGMRSTVRRVTLGRDGAEIRVTLR